MLTIYTDGSWIPGQDKRGYAGLGIWFGPNDIRNESRYVDGPHITHQFTELKAMQLAIQYARYVPSVEIISDSKYSINSITQWAAIWERNGWKTSKGEDVLYSDIIKSIREIITSRTNNGMQTIIRHVKGHSGDIGNDGADKLAKAASKLLEQIYMSNVIYFDSGKFSNFYHSHIKGVYKDREYKFMCVEQFYQYFKAIEFGDENTALNILNTESQFSQKHFGQCVKGFQQAHWDTVKEDVMYHGVLNKFSNNDEFKTYLLSTANKIIVEARPDKEWGIGITRDQALRGMKWDGKNLLGKVLMRVRSEL